MLEKTLDLLAASKVLAGIVGFVSLIITILIIFGGGYFFIILAVIDVYEMVKSDTVSLGGILWAAILFGLRGLFSIVGIIVFGFLALIGLSVAFDGS